MKAHAVVEGEGGGGGGLLCGPESESKEREVEKRCKAYTLVDRWDGKITKP